MRELIGPAIQLGIGQLLLFKSHRNRTRCASRLRFEMFRVGFIQRKIYAVTGGY